MDSYYAVISSKRDTNIQCKARYVSALSDRLPVLKKAVESVLVLFSLEFCISLACCCIWFFVVVMLKLLPNHHTLFIIDRNLNDFGTAWPGPRGGRGGGGMGTPK